MEPATHNTQAAIITSPGLREVYFLTQILRAKVYWQGNKIGRLTDVVMAENGKLPEVTHIVVGRPFGHASLYIPLEKVKGMSAKIIMVELEALPPYEKPPGPETIFLRDHILDKKVLDIEDHEVEVVYDVKMVFQSGRLYVSAVDYSRFGFLRRMHLKWLADLIYRPHDKVNQDIIPWTYIQSLPAGMGSFKGDVKLNILKDKLADIPPQDLADILEEMDREQRAVVFAQLETEHASDTLEEIDPSVQRDLVAYLSPQKVAQLINEMTPGQAADILSVLPMDAANNLLKLMEPENARRAETILDRQGANILDFATQDYIKLPPERTAGEIQEEYPHLAKGKDVVMYLYITGPEDKLLGIVDLKELLQADDSAQLKDIMNDSVISLNPDSTLKEASHMFVRYGFRALPVTDRRDKILGVVPYRDVMTLKHRMLV